MHRSVGIVLVGGLSSRIGTSKAFLEWHGSTLARRVVGIVARGVDGPVVVVRSKGQPLPSLPPEVEVLDDREDERGPVAGLAVGLAALSGRGEVAYVSSTDAPFLHPAFIRRVVGEVGDGVEACVPHVRGFRQPLAAAYRVDLAWQVQRLVDENRLRLSYLAEICRAVELDEGGLLADANLARVDPDLDSVTNLNELSDYKAARAKPAPMVIVERSKELLLPGADRRRLVSAATVGAAADGVGTPLDGKVLVSLNGDQFSGDGEEPTVEGDVISLMSATHDR